MGRIERLAQRLASRATTDITYWGYASDNEKPEFLSGDLITSSFYDNTPITHSLIDHDLTSWHARLLRDLVRTNNKWHKVLWEHEFLDDLFDAWGDVPKAAEVVDISGKEYEVKGPLPDKYYEQLYFKSLLKVAPYYVESRITGRDPNFFIRARLEDALPGVNVGIGSFSTEPVNRSRIKMSIPIGFEVYDKGRVPLWSDNPKFWKAVKKALSVVVDVMQGEVQDNMTIKLGVTPLEETHDPEGYRRKQHMNMDLTITVR